MEKTIAISAKGGCTMANVFDYYLFFINCTAAVLMAIDKQAACSHKRRIPERTLFLIALLGGSVGLYLGMLIVRHKTRHWYFRLGIPALIILQTFLLKYFK